MSDIREFRNRFTVIPDSGITELNCSRCPGPASRDTWQVGYHPSLDVLVEQARAHDLAVHGERHGPDAEAKLAAVRDLCRSIPSPIAERILAIIGDGQERSDEGEPDHG